jgi:tetratricopeptide (TPR) repeat protein
LNNLKLCSLSLLNLINILDINGSFQEELASFLFSLNDIYVELNNLNGQLYTSQLIAYYYHKNQKNYDISIKFYLTVIDLCKNPSVQNSNKLVNVVQKTLFNLSLCYKHKKMYFEAYKYHLEYLCMLKMNVSNDQQEMDYLEYESLGIIADLLLNINQKNTEIAIRIHVNRLNIIKKYLTVDDSDTFIDQNQDNAGHQNSSRIGHNRIYLIYDCFESLSKCYALDEDYDNVFKFKLVQFKLCLKNFALNKFKIKILFDLANVLLFKFNNHLDARNYFEHALSLYNESNDTQSKDNFLLVSLIYGNLGM